MKSREFEFVKKIDSSITSPIFGNIQRTANNALEINLNTGAIVPIKLNDQVLNTYMGGRALSLRLFAEYMQNNKPLEESPIVITSCVMNNTLTPYSDSFSLSFLSPVTKRLCTFSSLAKVGVCLNTHKLNAIIITGKLDKLSILNIDEESTIKPCNLSDNLSTNEIDSYLRDDNYDKCIMTTGPSASAKSPLASVVCDNQILGRAGLGLLFAQKGLKAITFTPNDAALKLPLKTKLKEQTETKPQPYLKKLKKRIKNSLFIREQGQDELKLEHKSRFAGFLPVSNFSHRTDPRFFYLISRKDVNRWIYKNEEESYPLLSNQNHDYLYSQIAMLGANMGIYDIEKVGACIIECKKLGLDPISVGNILGWAIDQYKKGNLETYSEFGELTKKNLLKMINKLANPRSQKLYGQMAQGIKAASTSIGADSGYQICNLECGPYDYRAYQSMAIEDYFGYNLTCPCEPLLPLYSAKPKTLAKYIVWNNNIAEGMESLGFSQLLMAPVLLEKESLFNFLSYFMPSLFLRFFSPRLLCKLFTEETSYILRPKDLTKLGKACYLLETSLNQAIGAPAPEFPAFFKTDPSCANLKPRVLSFAKLLAHYLAERGTK